MPRTREKADDPTGPALWELDGVDSPRARQLKPRAAACLGAGLAIEATAARVGLAAKVLRRWLGEAGFKHHVALASRWWWKRRRELELERLLEGEAAAMGGYGTSGRKRDENMPRMVIDPYAVPKNGRTATDN